MRTLEELRTEVEAAFAARRPPDQEAIADRHPRYATYEGNRVAAFFGARDWHSVTLDALRTEFKGQYSSMIFLLWPEAFIYFLPAFLLTALDFGDALDMADSLSAALTKPVDQGEYADWFRARTGSLLPVEERAVVDVLRYLAQQYAAARFDDNPAQKALDSYWAQIVS